MWRLFLEQLLRDIERQVVKQGPSQGVQKVGLDLIGEANKPEAYADRINREFNLRDYAKAWDLHDSNRAYWEKFYGDDPLTSLAHPASPPMSLLPHQPGAIVSGYNLLNPAVPFASPNPIPLPGRPATFDQRFEPSSSLAPNGASSDDLGGFRRQWLKTFMEP